MRRVPLVATLLVLAAAPAIAQESVQIEVAGTQRARGTLRTGSESERYEITAPAGSVVSASVKRSGKRGAKTALGVTDTGGGAVPGAVVGSTATGASLKKLRMGETADLALTVSALAESEYDLRIVLAPPKKASVDGGPTTGGEGASASFGAVAGSVLKVSVKPAGPPGFAAELDSLHGPEGETIDLPRRTGPRA
jgi:hypothetical protein